ncbi:hypothetical protein [Natrinema sp. DC36]|uniref:hypothetical protein n=1 Tax=Natrinema sp. DC36 TaxID=2878680 RepID=UPI001CF0290F|nr:hypothetical protein [Natrinema sp. DC36]
MSSQIRDLQPQDRTGTRTAARNKLSEKIERKRHKETLNTEAHVRDLHRQAEAAIVDGEDTERTAEQILEELHLYLWHDPGWPSVMHSEGPPTPASGFQFRQIHRQFQNGQDTNVSLWYEVLTGVAKGLGYVNSGIDRTQRAPVYLEKLDPKEVPHAPDIDEVTPIGWRRIGADDPVDPEEKEVVIPHDDCDHILAIAKPREGKDSTLTSIGMNLWREHGYKYVSIHDDGRMETPMLAIPADEQAIKDSLERFNQQPRPMDAEVYVPRMEGTPDILPSNFVPFTLGIDMLTPKDILRLAGVTDSDPSLELRIKEALKITLDRSGQVDELINLLFDFAEGLEATIEWTEEQDRHADSGVETYQASFSLNAEKAVKKAAQRLARLAGEGFIASPEAATNIDFHDLLEENDKAAVLCCNFIDASDGFKYTIMDLWLQKIMSARDKWPRLPRVCLEVRELKNLAPSQIQHARYRDQKRALQQTFRIITSQGGSRRVLLLGSTQKFNDVLKSVRNNMDTKIFLRQSQEQVPELDKMMNFNDELFGQLLTFDTGQGMIHTDGEPYWPIRWRGSPCGLGLGDQVWRDRYGSAWGARVRQTGDDPFADGDDAEWWVDVVAGDVLPASKNPAVGAWYLLPSDFPEPVASIGDPEDVVDAISERLIDWVLRQRREYDIPADLSLRPVGAGDRQQDITLEQIGQETTYEDIASRHNVPRTISDWLRKDAKLRQTFITVCELVAENEFRSYDQIHAALNADFGQSALRHHASNESGLKSCLEKEGQLWTLTPVGKQVLEIDWGIVEKGLQEVSR